MQRKAEPRSRVLRHCSQQRFAADVGKLGPNSRAVRAALELSAFTIWRRPYFAYLRAAREWTPLARWTNGLKIIGLIQRLGCRGGFF